ncbi:hypothetical protein GCM10009789_69810 [Kribbella sancticallisti]|uniref:YbaB/EbfC DNA-binding family protein n=1 Tax=Kribbella sancticallisti TaxID=460087 RepID=A0ABN2EF66_9ACTN
MSKEPVGSVAEEAAKLFAVLQQAARQQDAPPAEETPRQQDAPPAEETSRGETSRGETSRDETSRDETSRGEAPGPEGEPGAEQFGVRAERTGVQDDHAHGTAHSGGPECQWCPVCQLIAKVRSTSPETIEQLSMAAAAVLGSVRSLLEDAAEAARQARVDAESRTAGAQEPERPARSPVDRIDVSEDPEPWD